MALNQGKLANIDRRVFAELDRIVGSQAVKVPVSAAVWSTWRRYCEAIGLSMGEGVAGLIAHELETVVDDSGIAGPVFSEQAEREAADRMSRLDTRECELAARAESLRLREQDLRSLGLRVGGQERRPGLQSRIPNVGRNERCPCGSGFKYKRCHGLARRPDVTET